MKAALVKCTVQGTFWTFYLAVMLLICQAHDLIKSILFSLTFEHSPVLLVAWGWGLGAAVPWTACMSQPHVTKSCQVRAAELCWGRAASGSDISGALQGELGRWLPMKWLLITQERSARAGWHTGQSIFVERPDTWFSDQMTCLGPAKLIVLFLSPHTVFGEKVQPKFWNQPLICGLVFLTRRKGTGALTEQGSYW